MLARRCFSACTRRLTSREVISPLNSSSRPSSWISSARRTTRGTLSTHVQPILSRHFRASAARIQPNSRGMNLGARAAGYTTDANQNELEHATVKDDSHPSLFYHLFDDQELFHPVFALSFIEQRPGSARSKTVLGWLPALAPSDTEDGGNGLNDFRQNEDFLPVLHKVIRDNLPQDEIWANAAIQTQSGWMHIFDQRKIPPLGRIPDPDDILASVRVEDGRMLINTYEPMPSYRLCTADGVCQLTDTLMDQLRTTMEEIAEGERQNH